jgi:sialate O-acetylesterase
MSRIARYTIAALFMSVGQAQAVQQVLHPMFQDHGVLQRDQPIRVYGRSTPGEEITVTLSAASVRARADSQGVWSALLPALPAGGPHTLVARASGGATQTVNDVLIGDVWLCSGQSNMVLPVKNTLDARAEIANSANARIRMLTVGLASSARPRADFATPVRWEVASPATAAEWSATCFYFVRELQKTMTVPMGMVNASWNGSNIQTWMSDAALRAVGGFDDGLDALRLYASDASAATRRWAEIWESWWRSRAPAQTSTEPWRAAAPETYWRAAPANLGFWETWGTAELANYNGMVWYRTDVELNADQAAQSATLSLGPIDEIDLTWVNAKAAGGTSGAGTKRLYELPRGTLRAGNNTIVVNALDTYATGGLYGPAQDRVLRLSDGTAIPLAQWRYQVAPSGTGSPPRMPWEATGGLTVVHNAMIVPIGAYNFRGVVWYQGESNTGEGERYQSLLAGLMADWRAKFGRDLPFLIVQLANYGAAASAPVNSGWARLREAQRQAVLADANAGLAVTIDIGDRYDIHPANKQELGRRLARAARHVVYGEAIAPSGPVPTGASRQQNDVVVRFRDVQDRLVAYSAEGPIGFELCGTEQTSCRFASARIDANQVRLIVPSGLTPTRVRFCWADSPVCTLYDRSGLPAGPFELPVQQR